MDMDALNGINVHGTINDFICIYEIFTLDGNVVNK